MGKKSGAQGAGAGSAHAVQERAQRIADEFSFELVEVVLQKESRGKCLCVFIDKDGGISLDDCEHYHKRLQPLLEDIDYDFMEVSSPGVDRPIKTLRDFEKNRGALVEVKLFAPKDGSKLYRGALEDMTETTLAIQTPEGKQVSFERKTVAIVKPVIQVEEEDLPPEGEGSYITLDEMEPE